MKSIDFKKILENKYFHIIFLIVTTILIYFIYMYTNQENFRNKKKQIL